MLGRSTDDLAQNSHGNYVGPGLLLSVRAYPLGEINYDICFTAGKQLCRCFST